MGEEKTAPRKWGWLWDLNWSTWDCTWASELATDLELGLGVEWEAEWGITYGLEWGVSWGIEFGLEWGIEFEAQYEVEYEAQFECDWTVELKKPLVIASWPSAPAHFQSPPKAAQEDSLLADRLHKRNLFETPIYEWEKDFLKPE